MPNTASSYPERSLLRLDHKFRSRISSYLDVKSFVRIHITCCHTFDHFAVECGCGCESHCQHHTFEKICQSYHNAAFSSTPLQRFTLSCSVFGWINHVKEQLLLPQLVEECYLSANLSPLEEWMAEHEGTMHSPKTQRLLISSLSWIFTQNPVQAASRRAWIFGMLLKRLQNNDAHSEQWNRLLTMAEERRHKHFVRLLKKRRASPATVKVVDTNASTSTGGANTAALTLAQVAAAFDSHTSKEDAEKIINSSINADAKNLLQQDSPRTTRLKAGLQSTLTFIDSQLTSPTKKIKTGENTSSPVLSEENYSYSSGSISTGSESSSCSDTTLSPGSVDSDSPDRMNAVAPWEVEARSIEVAKNQKQKQGMLIHGLVPSREILWAHRGSPCRI